MAVRVKLFSTLVKLSARKQAAFDVPWQAGLTVAEVRRAAGFSERDAEAIVGVVNGEQAEPTRRLADGDRVEFLVNLQGGV